MKTNRLLFFRWLVGILPLLAGTGVSAAPLTWFPGPSLDWPVSGAAAAMASDGSNLLIGGDSYYPESLGATNAYWTPLPGLFVTVVAPGAAANGDTVIVYGGTDGSNSQSTVINYSPSGDSVPTLPSMSVARSYFGYASDASGNAYAIGGLDANGQPLLSAEYFNQDSSAWAPITPLPIAQYDFPAVFDGANQIYIFGGRTNVLTGTETATVLRYSIQANTWAALPVMPVATAGSAATFGADGKIYVVGGVSGGVTTNLVQVYDPTANAWVISTPLPEGLTASSMGVDTLGRLIVMGGMDTNGNDVANVWRSQQLNVPNIAPGFVSYPTVLAAFQVPYVSSINATGNPQPTYLILNGPDGMNVDTYSGAITWTPQASQIGTNAVTIRATNYAGYADWNFTMVIANPPPIAPTNLAVVGVTDNSVTLSWNPEDPVVGPTIYSVWLRHFVHSPRGSGGTTWYTQIGSNTPETTITIAGLTPGLAQGYYVVATAAGGKSGYGIGIGAATTAPQGPTNLWVTGLTSTSVSLAWNAAPGPDQSPGYSAITSYTIMERDVAVSPATNIPTVTNITGTNGTITGLTPGKAHIWFVSSVDAYGNASPMPFFNYVVVTNPVPVSPQVSVAVSAGGGGFQFAATEGGSVIQSVIIQASTNPTDPNSWVEIGSFLPSTTSFTFTDTNAMQYPMRFYRIIAP